MQEHTANHRILHPCKYLPLLVLASLLIAPAVQGFHFNPPLALLCSNKTPTQIQHIRENPPIQSNRTFNLTPFLRFPPVHQDTGDTEESVLETQDPQPSIKSPPSPNIDHPQY